MIQKGFALTERTIRRLRELQYSGLYIDDEISKGIEINETISGELRTNVTRAVFRLLTNVELNSSSHFADDMNRLYGYLDTLLDEILSTRNAVVNIIDIKEFDLYTYQHSVNVCVLSCIVGMAQNMPRADVRALGIAALLHDIGKVFVDKKIINKPDKLTVEEFEAIKKHPTLGGDYLRKTQAFSSAVLVGVLEHHERYNGQGYPLGLQGDKINTFAQIISVADVYDALTSVRPYHDPVLPSDAYEYIMGNGGQQFSWDAVNTFVKKVAPFPLGMQVLLSDGRKGIVYKNHDDFLTRPLIKLFPEPGDTREQFLDLMEDHETHKITIQKVFI
jgi:HD-GYP domain-containing protein (c-di-GMP phosphodiesterase class II)